MDNNKQCDGCQVAANVPYAAFEAVSARAERNIRRLALIIVFLILALIGSNIAWLCYESQFEDVTSQTEQKETPGYMAGCFLYAKKSHRWDTCRVSLAEVRVA